MKKLLVLGASCNEVDVVKKAQTMGLYVIVTDSNTDWSISPAKYIANESWNISWSDISALKEKCIENHVNGVIAGFSEFRVENMIKLCEAIQTPCYINMKQLDLTRDKAKFKDLCREYNLPVVREFKVDDENIEFPVIVKPVDRAGSIGINVAYNEEEYSKYLQQALDLSPSKNVIIEEFIHNGIKFDCLYYIHNSIVEYIGSSDTVMLQKEKGFETLQKAWSFPSHFEQEFLDKIDTKMKRMIAEGLGFKNGYGSVSCFYRNGEFYIFETGFRLSGGHSFDYQQASTGRNYLETMINHALGERVSDEQPWHKGKKALIYNLYFNCNQGEIMQSLEGVEELKSYSDIITFVQYAEKGFKFKGGPQKVIMCTIYTENLSEIQERVAFINEKVRLVTDCGTHAIYGTLKSEEIETCWK